MKTNTCGVCFVDFRCLDDEPKVPWHASPNTNKECEGSHTERVSDEAVDARMDACSKRSDELLAEAMEKLCAEFPEYSLDEVSAELRHSQERFRSFFWKETLAPMLKAWLEKPEG